MTTIIIPGGGSSIKSIQRGTINYTSDNSTGTTDITATLSTSVDVSKSILSWQPTCFTSAGGDAVVSATLTNSTTVTGTFARTGVSNSYRISFEVIEYN